VDYEPPKWITEYIGVEYKENGRDCESGVDCWGLIKCIYDNEFNIDLPDYNEKYEKRGKQYKLEENDYSFLESNWRKISMKNKEVGDLLLFDMNDMIFHVGMIVAKHKFIHVHAGIQTVLDEMNNLRWENRIHGLYRHNELSIS
jgi:cell wall-associated NlpC family hydrolase